MLAHKDTEQLSHPQLQPPAHLLTGRGCGHGRSTLPSASRSPSPNLQILPAAARKATLWIVRFVFQCFSRRRLTGYEPCMRRIAFSSPAGSRLSQPRGDTRYRRAVCPTACVGLARPHSPHYQPQPELDCTPSILPPPGNPQALDLTVQGPFRALPSWCLLIALSAASGLVVRVARSCQPSCRAPRRSSFRPL